MNIVFFDLIHPGGQQNAKLRAAITEALTGGQDSPLSV